MNKTKKPSQAKRNDPKTKVYQNHGAVVRIVSEIPQGLGPKGERLEPKYTRGQRAKYRVSIGDKHEYFGRHSEMKKHVRGLDPSTKFITNYFYSNNGIQEWRRCETWSWAGTEKWKTRNDAAIARRDQKRAEEIIAEQKRAEELLAKKGIAVTQLTGKTVAPKADKAAEVATKPASKPAGKPGRIAVPKPAIAGKKVA